MSLLIRIPALMVALGLLLSGGQVNVCEFAAVVGVDLHASDGHCSHSDPGHSHSEPEPCDQECLIKLAESIAPTLSSIPTLLITDGFDAFLPVDSAFLLSCGKDSFVPVAWHGPPLERLRSLHSDPRFSGRFLV